MRNLFLGAAILLLSSVSWADTIIYDNGTPLTTPGVACVSTCPELTSLLGAGVFALQSDSVITSVRFWTFEFDNSYHNGSLTWQIFQDNGGVQGSSLGNGSFTLSHDMATLVDIGGLQVTEYQNDFTVPSLDINPASPQSYFLDIQDPSAPPDTFGIFWATSAPDTLAFQLTGTGNLPINDPVPEPSSITLVALAVGSFYLGRKRLVRR